MEGQSLPGGHANLQEYPFCMVTDGVRAQGKLRRDFAIGQAIRKAVGYFRLPACQTKAPHELGRVRNRRPSPLDQDQHCLLR